MACRDDDCACHDTATMDAASTCSCVWVISMYGNTDFQDTTPAVEPKNRKGNTRNGSKRRRRHRGIGWQVYP